MPIGVNSMAEAVRCGAEIFHALKTVLNRQGLSTSVGDEGGFAPDLESNQAALEAIMEAIDKAGYVAGEEVGLALDPAASEFYDADEQVYVLASEGRRLSSEDMVDYYAQLVAKYPILSIEDGLDENDWEGWRVMTERLGEGVQIVGDDIYVTNTDKLARGIEEKSANAILIKVNQIGTLTETMEAIEMAHRHGQSAVISHRSGETEDTTIADLAVAVGSAQIKTGSLCRSDRVAKYNQLIRIEEMLGASAVYPSAGAFHQPWPPTMWQS